MEKEKTMARQLRLVEGLRRRRFRLERDKHQTWWREHGRRTYDRTSKPNSIHGKMVMKNTDQFEGETRRGKCGESRG